jgi:hypothetical protein
LKRAKRALGVGSEKEGDGSWSWVLPEREAEGGQAPIAGTLGTVGPLAKDAKVKQFESAYLRKRAKGATNASATTAILRAQGAICATQATPTGLGEQSGARVKG